MCFSIRFHILRMETGEITSGHSKSTYSFSAGKRHVRWGETGRESINVRFAETRLLQAIHTRNR